MKPEESPIEEPKMAQNLDTEADSATEENQAEQETNTAVVVKELQEKYIRLYSDFDNFRRRTAKEKIDLINHAAERVIGDLLSVLDDIERAELLATEYGLDKEGVELIFNKFKNVVFSKGLKAIVAKGETFDSDLHECITQFPAPAEEQKGKVIDEVEKGYYLNEKVIRYAKVIVGQ